MIHIQPIYRFLQAIGEQLCVESVLEMGSGKYSTPTFIDRETFPDMILLDVVETDPSYWHSLEAHDDPRLMIHRKLPEAWIVHYDLIFIDDGKSVDERVETIRTVAQVRPTGLVVIHDFEQPAYHDAADFDWVVIYDDLTPHTALCWNGDRDRLEIEIAS